MGLVFFDYHRTFMQARRKSLGWILLLALVLRGAVAIGAWSATGRSVSFAIDTITYVGLAEDLLAYGTFTFRGEPHVIRTPGYPLLLVPGVALGHVQGVTIAIQILLSLLTTIGVCALGRALSRNDRVGLVGAALFAIEPASIALTVYMLTETIAATLLVWAVYLSVRYSQSARAAHLIGAMLLFVTAAYVRPVTLFLPACVVGFLALRALFARQWRGVAHAVLAGTLAFALLAPWSLRNRAYGFPGFSAISAMAAYFYGGAQILVEQKGISQHEQALQMGWKGGEDWVDDDRYLQLHPEQRTWSRGQRYAYMRREGMKVMKGNLPQYAVIHAKGMFYTLISSGGGELGALFGLPWPKVRFAERVQQGGISARDLLHVGLGVFLLLLYLLAAYGFVSMRWTAAVLIVVGSAAYMIAAAGGTFGETRFRVPVMPLVCAMAGVGGVLARRRIP